MKKIIIGACLLSTTAIAQSERKASAQRQTVPPATATAPQPAEVIAVPVQNGATANATVNAIRATADAAPASRSGSPRLRGKPEDAPAQQVLPKQASKGKRAVK